MVTHDIEDQLPEIREVKTGLAFLHLKHTSASLTLNENADPDVRKDMESIFNNMVRENEPWYVHTFEGPDDMPAHAKSRITSYNVCYTKLLRLDCLPEKEQREHIERYMRYA